MSRWTVKFKQVLYPPEFRIIPDDNEASLAVMVSHLAALVESLPGRMSIVTATLPVQSESAAEAPTSGPDKAFVIRLCNQLHRLNRSVKKALEQGSPEADKLNRQMEGLEEVLGEYAVEWEDLSGQAYDPGRADFEALGQPDIVPNLVRDTILQCERPAISVAGEIIQKAKGAVGRPPD